MASGQVQFKALVLIALIFGATAEECVCKDEGYEISYWRAGLCAAGAVALAPVALGAAGFTSAGVAAGSVAAAAQGTIGANVAAGSIFAWLQSAGMVGVGYGAGAGIGTAAGALCGITKKESCCNGKK